MQLYIHLLLSLFYNMAAGMPQAATPTPAAQNGSNPLPIYPIPPPSHNTLTYFAQLPITHIDISSLRSLGLAQETLIRTGLTPGIAATRVPVRHPWRRCENAGAAIAVGYPYSTDMITFGELADMYRGIAVAAQSPYWLNYEATIEIRRPAGKISEAYTEERPIFPPIIIE